MSSSAISRFLGWAPSWASLQQEVVSGRGFTLLRDVPIQGLTQQQVMLLYWGIGTHWGTAVPQNAKGHMIGHVKVSLPGYLPVFAGSQSCARRLQRAQV